jgi:hypothetical protein
MENGITPSLHEKGMFNAFSASLLSACLSRQVGAAIVDNMGMFYPQVEMMFLDLWRVIYI